MRTLGVFLTAILMLTSCSKEAIQNLLPEMNATIDGNDWVSTVRTCVEQDGTFIITGTSISGKTVIVTIFGDDVGTYELSTTSQKCAAVYKESVSAEIEGTFGAVSGTVKLTDVGTSTISGTFSFSFLRGQLENFELTNGVFNKVKFTSSFGSDQ